MVLVTPCAHRGWRGTDGFRLVALVLRAERDMRKVFRTLVARNVILVSHCRLFAREQPPFPGYFDHSSEIFMAEAKTNTASPDRSSLPAIGYSLLLAALVAGGLHALFISGPAMRVAAHEQVERAIADEDRGFCEMFGIRLGSAEFTACSRQLAIIRQKQVDRDNAAAQGLL